MRARRCTALVALIASAALGGVAAAPVHAHGGQYQAPGGGIPPYGVPPTTAPIGPGGSGATPTFPGGVTPTTPGSAGTTGRRRGPARMNTSWSAWWEAHADDYWAGVVAVPVTTGEAVDAERVRAVAREKTVVPFLRRLLADRRVRDADVRSAALIALGKSTAEPHDVDLILASLRDLSCRDVEREGAAIALGCLRRTDAASRLDGTLLDRVRAALLDAAADEGMPRRARCFSFFAVGLLGDQPGREGDAFGKDLRSTTHALWTRLVDENDDELEVACLVALSLEPPAGVPSTALAALRGLATTGDLARRGRGPLVQAHAVLAYARLAGDESAGVLLGLVRSAHDGGDVGRSAVLALGALAPSLDAPGRAAAVDALLLQTRRGNPDTAGFAILSLGRLLAAAFRDGASPDGAAGPSDGTPEDRLGAATRAADGLLDAAAHGPASMRAFAVVAAGVALRESAAATASGARTRFLTRAVAALSEIVDHEGADPDLRGAAAIGLGLAGDAGSLPRLGAIVEKSAADAVLRSRAAAATGLVGLPVSASLATLRGALARKNPDELRREAARSLGALGDRTAVPALVTELSSDAPDHVRARAAIALGAIRSTAAVDPLVSLASDPSMADLARAVAAAALGLVVDPERPKSLTRLNADGNFLARTDALIEALSLL